MLPVIRIRMICLVGVILAALLGLGACGRSNASLTPVAPASQSGAATATLAVAPTLTPAPPTATPEPLAAQVNGLGIPLAQYHDELERMRLAYNRELTPADQQSALDALIDQALLAQAAYTQGFTLDEAGLQARLDKLVEQAGGRAAFEEWMKANFFTEASFMRDLAVSAAAAWMRDQAAAQVPAAQEQVHARQMLFSSAAAANTALGKLQAGENFTTLAALYDPVKRGDLGWFPRGYLTDARLDEAVFGLEVGQYTPVIQTSSGYHILLVIERQTDRPLEPQARLALQHSAVLAWLKEQRTSANIQILVK